MTAVILFDLSLICTQVLLVCFVPPFQKLANFGIILPIPMFTLSVTKNLSTRLIDTGLKLIPIPIKIGSLKDSLKFLFPFRILLSRDIHTIWYLYAISSNFMPNTKF